MKKIYFLIITILMSVACSKKEAAEIVQELSVKTQSITLKVGEAVEISAISSKKISYSSENSTIASVNEKGLVVGKLKGKTLVKVSDGNKEFDVEILVEPTTSNLFFEPILVASKDEFKQKYAQSGGTFSQNTYQDFYTLETYDEYTFNPNTENAYRYVFYDDTPEKEIMIEVSIHSPVHSLEKIMLWVSERFIPLQQKGDFFYYVSEDKTTMVTLDYDIERETTQVKIFKIPTL